jgi:hypothetical protein
MAAAGERYFTYGSMLRRDHTQNPRIYNTIGIVITNNEIPDGGRGLSDVHRGNSKDLFDIISLINGVRDEAKPMCDTSGSSSAYFCRIPEVGIFIWISMGSEDLCQRWSSRIYTWVKKMSAVDGRGRMNTEYQNTEKLVMKLNSCFHDLYPRSGEPGVDPHLRVDLTYDFLDIKMVFNELAKMDPDEMSPDGFFLNVCETHPRVLLNPFVALDIRRTFTTHLMMQLERIADTAHTPCSLSWLVYGNEDSIFQEDGYMHLENIPEGVRIFKMSTDSISPTHLFPDILPAPSVLRDKLCTTPEMADFIRDMSNEELMRRCLEEPPMMHGEPVCITNPVSKTHHIVDYQGTKPFGMPYMVAGSALLRKFRQLRGVNGDDVRRKTSEVFASCIRSMCNSPTTTPQAPQAIAKCVQEGLNTYGMHWLRPEERPAKEESAAYLAYLVLAFEGMGASVHHTTIGLFALSCALTNYVTDDGGVHTCTTGYPGDGKSYFYTKILMPLIPGSQNPISFSKQAFYDATALSQYKMCAIFKDEMSQEMLSELGVDTVKMLLGGAADAHRIVNSTFAANGATPAKSVLPTPLALMSASNKMMQKITYESESDNIDGISAVLDRFVHKILPLMSELDEKYPLPATLARYRDSARQGEVAGPVRFYISICMTVCMFVSHGLITSPINLEYDNIVDGIIAEMRTQTGKDDVEKKNRLRLAIQNLSIVFAVMRRVFERCVQGGDYRTTGCLEYLCDILADISFTLVPSASDIVAAVSLVLDSTISSDESVHVAQNILDKVTQFSFDKRMFVVDDIAKLAGESSKPETQMRKDLHRLTDSVIGYNADNTPIHAAVLVRGTIQANDEYLINPAYFRNAIESGTNHFDGMFCAALSAMHDRSVQSMENEEASSADMFMLNVDPDTGLVTTDVEVVASALFESLHGQDRFVISNNDSMLINHIRKRFYLGYFKVAGPDWLTKLTVVGIVQLPPTAVLVIDKAYFNMFSDATRKVSKTAQTIARVLKQPGVYPLIVPSKPDVRVPEYVEIGSSQEFRRVETSYIDNTSSGTRVGRKYKRIRIDEAPGRSSYDMSLKNRLADYGFEMRVDAVPDTHMFPTFADLKRRFGCDPMDLGNVQADTPSFKRFSLRGDGHESVVSADDFIAQKILKNIERSSAVGSMHGSVMSSAAPSPLVQSMNY